MPAHTDRPRRTPPVHATPASLLERLEPRVHLAAFAYQSLADYLDVTGPLHVLRPSGAHGSAETLATSIAAIGDVDGDGVPDILVGSAGHGHGHEHEHDDDHHPRGALAAVYSGATGTLLFTVSDGARGYGSSVAGLGDVNGDGTPDFAVGSPRWGGHAHGDHHDHDHDHGGPGGGGHHHPGGGHHEQGRVYIYSGVDGALLHTLTGEGERHRFGTALAAAGDVDGDGTPDLLVGAPGSHPGGHDHFAGRVYLVSGADGSVIRTFDGTEERQRFGAALAGAGDIDGDGTPDLIIGAPRTDGHGNDEPGSVFVISGEDGSVIFTFTGDQRRDLFGFAVAGGGDANGDGIPDIAVGAPGWRGGGAGVGAVPFAGQVTVFSGADGSVLHFVDGERPRGNLGASVSFAGDVDGDGADDLLIGQPLANPDARVIVLSGDDGAVLGQFVARDSHLVRSDRLGTAAVALGDVDGDGFTDFAFAGTKNAKPEHGDRSRVYIFSGVTALPLRPEGINDEGVIWGTVGGDGGGAGREWIFMDGRIRLLSTIDGFTTDDTILDVNNDGVILAARIDGDTFEPFIWDGGVRTPLADLITTFDGPDGMYTAMLGVDITDSGKILVQRLDDGGASTVWVLDGGTLTYLFDGVPVAMTEGGIVVGLDVGGFDPAEPITNVAIVLDTAAGEAVEIEGFFAVDVNEFGAVVGLVSTDEGVRSAVWEAGTLTALPRINGGERFIAQGINDGGRVVGTYLRGGDLAGFYYDPEKGIFDITAAVHGAPATFTGAESLALADINNNGVVVGYTDGGVRTGFVLVPSAVMQPGIGRLGGRVDATLAADGTLSVVTVNAMGETVIFRRDARTGAWTATNLADDAGTPMALEAAAYTDPRTGRAVYIIASGEGLFIVTDAGDGQWTVAALSEETGGTAITMGLTTFMSLDGRIYIAGIDGAGDLVAYHSAGDAWTFENISVDHLAAGGAEVPMFQGRLVSYVTSWNGLNIAGLDEDGNIWAVWTSPEMNGQWTSSNLSAITQTPALRGGLTPYLTPWGGINLAAVNIDGETIVTWWVPSFGGHWARNNFTREMGFAKLRAESVSSFVTPWGGLNITGLDDNGRVVVLWWAPATNVWQLARLDMDGDGGEGRGRSLRRIDGYCAPDGSMSLLGIGRGGSVLRMHWQPDSQWLFEDLTERVRS